MNFLLAIDPNTKLKAKDAFVEGGQTLLLGMGAVFAVLIIIWISLLALKFFIHDLPARKSAAPKPAPAPVAVAPVKAAANDSDEIVAVIAAAIAMAESENSGLKFRVVSFRRK